LDFVCGQPDRHAQNVMVDPDGEVRLIDAGSAFAGANFNPAFDKNSFVPYYLRAWAPEEGFNGMSPAERLRYLPRVAPHVREDLTRWLDGLDAGMLEAMLREYGIQPGPTMDRLRRLKDMAKLSGPDEAINRLWVTE